MAASFFAGFQNVGIGAGGGIYGAVSQALRNQLQVFPGFQQHSCMSVAHGVYREAFPELLAVHIEEPYGITAHESAVAVMHDIIILEPDACETCCSLSGLFGAQDRNERFADRYAAETAGGLWRVLNDKTVRRLDNSLGDRQLTAVEVNVLPCERAAFPEPRPGMIGDSKRQEELVPLREPFKDFLYLSGRKSRYDTWRLRVFRYMDILRRIPMDIFAEV